jgi:hypothetical protein
MNLENVVLENIRMEAENGMTCGDAKNIKIKNLTLITKKAPAIDFYNSSDVAVDGLVIKSSETPMVKVAGSLSEKLIFRNSGMTNPEKQLVIGKEVSKNAVNVVK